MSEPEPVVTVETNPFKFTPEQLMELVDPKNLNQLAEYGHVKGILEGLHVDPQVGLDSTSPASLWEERIKFFGRNVLPPVKSKNIFQLIWLALHDKILILLCVAAAFSLAVGLYQDFNPKRDPAEPRTHWIEGVAIIISICIVVLVQSVNDYQKEKKFRELNAINDDRSVKAIRKGAHLQVSVYDVLVGDVLSLEPGDVTCADGVLIQGTNLKIDESAATGESDTIKKNAQKDPFILSGSKVSEGVGQFVVIAVGENSFFGKTMMALRTDDDSTPLQVKLDNLAEKIAKLGSAIGITMFLVLILKYVITTVRGAGFGGEPGQENDVLIIEQIIAILITAVTVVVVAVPEGLPLAVTLALAYGTKKMLKENCLVRLLSACETMGGATTVCSDKTGTLTQNKMTVVKGILAKNVTFEGADDIKKLPQRLNATTLSFDNTLNTIQDVYGVLTQSIAVNSSVFEETDPRTGETVFIGSKTETALLDWIKAMGTQFKTLRTSPGLTIEQAYPFSSERKSMSTLVRMDTSLLNSSTFTEPIYRVFVKGASEIVLNYCGKAAVCQGETVTVQPLTAELKQDFLKTINSLAEESLRTICLAYREWPESEFKAWLNGPIREKVKLAKAEEAKKEAVSNDGDVLLIRDQDPTASKMPEKAAEEEEVLTDVDILSHPLAWADLCSHDLTCLSIVGIEDPLRPGVPEAVADCQKAGVVVRMVTGDNIITAKAIASKCGIFSRGGIAMEGSAFRKLSTAEMDNLIPHLQVLARSSPTDKQLLVGRLKALGETVAVTGDGVNDGPALKMADIGFSMGIAGTEIAKEASSIILMDDNFSSIVSAMRWGRAINDSVKKFLQFQLTVNVTAVTISFISAIVDSEEASALNAVQLLWVNLIMDSFAALALATEGPSPDILDRPPESKSAPLITFRMWKMLLGQSILQIAINFTLLYAGPYLFESSSGTDFNLIREFSENGRPSILTAAQKAEYKDEKRLLRTIVFNTFVFLQVFNIINCRRLDNKLNVFQNIHKNFFFPLIFLIIVVGQVIIIFFGGEAFKTVPLKGNYWAISVLLGTLSLPWGMIIRLLPDELFSLCGVQTQDKTKPTFERVGSLDMQDPGQRWVNTIEKVQKELRVFSAIHGNSRSKLPHLERSGSFASSTRAKLSEAKRRTKAHTRKSNDNKPSMAAIAGIGIGLAGYGFVAESAKLGQPSST